MMTKKKKKKTMMMMSLGTVVEQLQFILSLEWPFHAHHALNLPMMMVLLVAGHRYLVMYISRP
jgi:hypothetical protein